ncbi:MAG: hypothetical protein L0Y35_03575 [Flammeovirgaceae bacterium]|nr:hypothetical protein [Flammeovirgaceae bacterium]
MNSFTFVSFALITGAAYWQWRSADRDLKIVYWPAFFVKLLAGVSFGIIYTQYYSISDSHIYFSDGNRIAQLSQRDFYSYLNFLWSGTQPHDWLTQLQFQAPRAVFMSKVMSIVILCGGKNYWLSTLMVSLLTFFPAWYFVSVLKAKFHSLKWPVVIAVLFFPSVLLWSSGIAKESVAMASLYYLSAVILRLYFKDRLKFYDYLLILFFGWLVWSLKYYYLAVWLPIGVSLLVVHVLLKPKRFEALIFFVIMGIMLLSAGLFHPNFIFEYFVDVITSNYTQIHNLSDAGDAIIFYNLHENNNQWTSAFYIVLNAPWALFSGLFRPFLWEVNSFMQIFAAIENLLLLVLTIGTLKNIKQANRSPHRLLLLAVITFVAILIIFLTLSTPNFGTLSRYRVGCLPFFVLLILSNNTWLAKFKKNIPFLAGR